MKKIIMMVTVFLVLVLCCTACKGDVTRSLRHEGYSYGAEFSCDAFFPKDKEDTSYDKIKYLTPSHVITEDGKIYEISMERAYSNEENCKLADTKLEVAAVFDNSIFKATDGKIYYLTGDSSTPYTEVTAQDNSYELYSLLLSQLGVLKVETVDANTGTYYALNSNGNVYVYNVGKEDRNLPLRIYGTSVVFKSSDYGGDIIDFNYAGNSPATYVKTKSKIFKMTAENGAECTKYADVECKYAIRESESYTEYKDYYLGFNGYTVITTYGRIFSVNK